MRRADLLRVVAIVLVWTGAGLLMGVYDELVRQTMVVGVPRLRWGVAVMLKTLGTAAGALVAAPLVVFVFKARLRGQRFATTVAVQGMAFATIAVAVTWLFGRWAAAWGPEGAAVAETSGAALLKATLFALILGGLTSFGLEVQDRIGRGAFLHFLLGRYHRARTERRCFMFLDLMDSTATAERLGHVEYFNLLNAFFADVTDALLETGGEVYQYVGDEVVVSWPEARGLRGGNCVRCLFLIQDRISERTTWYHSRFGTVPRFRAAFHTGEVTAGEVGVLKRDRVFTGDTLNTAARLEARCRVLGQEALVSAELADRLPEVDAFRLHPLDQVTLRGKADVTHMYSLRRL